MISVKIHRTGNGLKQYADSLTNKASKMVSALCERGVKYADGYLKHDDTGNTRSSIHCECDGTKGTVSAGGAAVWIEFGTGVIKNGSAGSYAHPKASELGMSPIGCYGHGNGSNPHGWWYMKDNVLYHTTGIASNPFMYQSSQSMRMDIPNVAREVFKYD